MVKCHARNGAALLHAIALLAAAVMTVSAGGPTVQYNGSSYGAPVTPGSWGQRTAIPVPGGGAGAASAAGSLPRFTGAANCGPTRLPPYWPPHATQKSISSLIVLLTLQKDFP